MLRKLPQCCQSLLRKRLRCCQATAEAAAALPELAAEAVAVPPALPVLEEPEFVPCKKARLVPTDVLGPLQTGQTIKAMAYLETLPAQHRADRLHLVLQQWRIAGAGVDKDAQRSQLRQVAAELGIPLSRGVLNYCSKVSHTIAEFFTARVSALRTFVVSSAAAMSGDMAATAAVAAQAAARGSGAGDPAVGSYAVVGSSVPKGKK